MNRVYHFLYQSIVTILIGFSYLENGLEAMSCLEWPTTLTYPADISVEIISETAQTEGSVYRSNHFELVSDYPISRVALCKVLRLLEANYASHQALPLGFHQTTIIGRHVIKLVDREEHDVEQGGMMGSGGVYLRESQEALISIDALDVELSEDGRIISIQNIAIIAHEITHQLQHDWLGSLPTWLIEGIAVYLESVPFHNGTLRFQDMHFRAEKHIARCSENQYRITNIQ